MNIESLRLGDIATFINGYAFKPEEWVTEGRPIIRIQNLTNSSNEINYYNKDIHERYIVRKGDILISWSASIGIYEWQGEEAVLNQHIFKVQFDKININKGYFKFIVGMCLENAIQYMHGSTMKHITKKYFDDILVPVPKLDVQKKVNTALEKAQELVDKRKAQIEALDELVKSRFIEMFSGEKYPMTKAEDVCEYITKGTTPKTNDIVTEYSMGLVPYLKVYNLSFDGSMLFEEKPQYVNEEIHNHVLARSKVFPNDVLMNIVGPPLGKFAIVPNTYKEWNINQAIAIFRANNKINPIYLLYSLKQPNVLRPFIDSAVGIRQQNISLLQCRNLKMPLPPLELQNQFAAFVSQVDKLKFEMQKSLEELENNFQSLMQRAFKGELFK